MDFIYGYFDFCMVIDVVTTSQLADMLCSFVNQQHMQLQAHHSNDIELKQRYQALP